MVQRDQRTCWIHGPRCRHVATVHHILPSSQRRQARGPCNYRDGAKIAAANRRLTLKLVRSKDEQIAYLERVVQVQEERIEALQDQITLLRNGPTSRNELTPAVH